MHAINTTSPTLRTRSSATWFVLTAAALLGACNTLPTQNESASASSAGEAGIARPTLENRPTHLSLVRQMQANGLWFASLAHIDALEQRWGQDFDTQLLRAEALRNSDQSAASAEVYERLLNTSERAAAWRGLGLIAGNQGDYALAAERFDRARELLPTDGMLLNDLGYALLMSGQTAQARLPLMQASQLLPQHPRVRSNLALWLLAQGQRDAARQLMDDAGLNGATRQAIERQAASLAQPLAQPLAPPHIHRPVSASANDRVARDPDRMRLRTSLQLSHSIMPPAAEPAR